MIFFEDITLLVGLSGVGKTRILNAVEYSLNLAVCKDVIMRPYFVNMGIEIDGDIYEWTYKISGIEKEDILFENQEEYCIQYEKLIKNGDVIFERCNEDIRVMGYDRVPKSKKDESLLSQYSEDEEFENGLGVNCIDLLSEILLSERKDLQFIITSHHPKIINGIEQNRWKIIDRDGSIVKNSNSEKYGIGNSQHEAYFNLINRWEFEGKI